MGARVIGDLVIKQDVKGIKEYWGENNQESLKIKGSGKR